MAWQESHWLQFANSENDPDNTYACTLVSEDCGYGLMQITSCMSDGCGWFAPIRVAGELTYNLGTGTNFLIKKWNEMPRSSATMTTLSQSSGTMLSRPTTVGKRLTISKQQRFLSRPPSLR
jgi:hypothetical protein